MASDLTPPQTPSKVTRDLSVQFPEEQAQARNLIIQSVSRPLTKFPLSTPPDSPLSNVVDRRSAPSETWENHTFVTAWLNALAKSKDLESAAIDSPKSFQASDSTSFKSDPSSWSSQEHGVCSSVSHSVAASEAVPSQISQRLSVEGDVHDLKAFTRQACLTCHTSGLRCVFPDRYNLHLLRPQVCQSPSICLRCKRTNVCCILRQPLSYSSASRRRARNSCLEFKGELYFAQMMERETRKELGSDRLLMLVQALIEEKEGKWRFALPKADLEAIEGVQKGLALRLIKYRQEEDDVS